MDYVSITEHGNEIVLSFICDMHYYVSHNLEVTEYHLRTNQSVTIKGILQDIC